MKRSLSSLLFALVLIFGVVGGVDAASGTINIIFDGFCDGATLTYDTASGYCWGVQTGCSSGLIGGVVGGVLSQGTAMVYSMPSAWAESGVLTYLVHPNGTWRNFWYDGNSIQIFLEGTWSYSAEGEGVYEGPSTAGP
jgi:hypothetical protein